MRNPDLDEVLPIDSKIGELLTDEVGEYKIINGERIYQMKEETEHDRYMNLILNRYRASGMKKPSEYLKNSEEINRC